MATPNYKPLLNSSENLKALLAEQNAGGITSAVFSGNEPIDVLSAKTIFNAAKSAEDIAGVSSITAGTGISVSGSTGNVTITSTVTGTLPTQTGNSGKLLTTDGTNSSWTTTPVATSLTGPTSTDLTLSGGSSGASLVLGSGASGQVTVSPKGLSSMQVSNGSTIGSVLLGGGSGNAELYADGSTMIVSSFGARPMQFYLNGAEKARFVATTGDLSLGTTSTATAVNTGGLQSANFGLSTVSGGASYFGGNVSVSAASGDTLTLLKGTGPSIKFQKTDATAQTWSVSGEGLYFRVYDTTAGTAPLSIASSTGAATFAGLVFPQQATTAGAPTYVKGAIYFDTTLNKLRVGGASAWETITSV